MKEKGFTLVELIVVIGIMVFLLSMATINFQAWSRKHSMEAQVKKMFTDVLTAKVDSMHRRRQLTMNVNGTTSVYDVKEGATVVMPSTSLKYPVTTSAGNNLSLIFDVNGINMTANSPQTICLQTNDPGLAYDSIIVDQVKVNLAKRKPGGNCVSTDCTIK